ncbi:MAG: alcohol dehydrogenase catalytic domain-containing protein [Chloroflexi bacterium]|nr:alcohol dehydrogenase catalytic domain-containing protein [Chloroflexota bacterium]
MKCIVYKGKEHMALEDHPMPTIQDPADVLLRVTMSAICGSDLHAYNEDRAGQGQVMGHEFIGIVEEVGPRVERLKPGDRVVLPFGLGCGACFYCKRGWHPQCPHYQRFGLGSLPGGQAQYVRVPMADANAVHLPPELPDETAVLLSDILCTGYFCAEQGSIRPGDYVAVVGCGPVGMMAQMAAHLFGPALVIAIDTVPYRLDTARYLWGAVPLNAAEPSLRERVLALTEGRGADVVLEAVGTEGRGLDTAFEVVRPAGTISMVGVPTVDTYTYPLRKAYTLDLTYKVGRCPARRYIEQLIPLLQTGRIHPERIITHVLPLDQAPEGYRIFASREPGVMKVLLKP